MPEIDVPLLQEIDNDDERNQVTKIYHAVMFRSRSIKLKLFDILEYDNTQDGHVFGSCVKKLTDSFGERHRTRT